MSAQQIIMNFVPPSYDDLAMLAKVVIDDLPEELLNFYDEIMIEVEDIAEDVLANELEVEDPFEILVLFKSEKEITPGVEKKNGDNNGSLVIFRRAVLDVWCQDSEDLSILMRQIIIEELSRLLDLSDDEIEEMIERHHQGLL